MNRMFNRMDKDRLHAEEDFDASDSNVVNSSSNFSRSRLRDNLEEGDLRHTLDE